MILLTILIWALSYLLGSIPFGLVLCKAFGYGDIREIGSGNIGATNVLRTGNKPLALATFLLDTGKGAIAVLIATAVHDYEWFAWGAGMFAVIGHMYPVWLKFKGGKGVATTIGTLWALSWPLGLIVCAVWLLMAFLFRISSLSALTAFLAMPGLSFLFAGKLALPFATVIAILVYWRHKSNIERLILGTEPKMNFKK